jgi:hypothetical protein
MAGTSKPDRGGVHPAQETRMYSPSAGLTPCTYDHIGLGYIKDLLQTMVTEVTAAADQFLTQSVSQ